MHIHTYAPLYAHLFEHTHISTQALSSEKKQVSVQTQSLELPWYNSMGSDVAQVFQLW